MVPAPSLRNVMQQHRDVQDAARQQLAHQFGRQRMIAGQVALFDPGQQANGADRMFVHRIMVIHIELHLRHDAAEIGNEAPENGRFVHPAQHGFGITRGCEHIHEGRIGARVLAHLGGDQPGVAAGRADRAGVDGQAMAVGNGEDFQEPDRIDLKKIIAGQRQPTAFQDEAVQLFGPAKQGGDVAPPLRPQLIVQMGQEHGRQVAHNLGVQEIIAHEALHPRPAMPPCKAHPRRGFQLEVEGQPIFRPASDGVQVATHRPQEILRLLKLAQFQLGQQPDIDQFGHRPHPVHIFADPEQCVQVAQAALALLHIGFDDIAAVAHPFVALVTLGQLVGDKGAGSALHHFRVEAG